MPNLTIGVLALQGAFAEHSKHLVQAAQAGSTSPLSKYTVSVIEVRTPEQLNLTDALVLPGGESTAISLIAERTGLLDPLREYVQIKRRPVWGTCAGLILLSDETTRAKRGGQELIGGLHVRCQRNHYGRQTESFSAALDLPFIKLDDEDPFVAIFIRAPVVEKILASTDLKEDDDVDIPDLVHAPRLHRQSSDSLAPVEIIAKVDSDIVAVRQGSIFGTTFHPELTPDVRLHRWWLTDCVVPNLAQS
ncbi:class I glutamine amidotransferase-like protein [Lipomyces oligophaga]|uniref:class I glutamine amidotransferase-like protein n=1 Tax=Lipomyces oligophaga TaxID=45792 RepID=UPI0034CDE350